MPCAALGLCIHTAIFNNLISTHSELTLRMNGSYGLISKELELVSKLM